MVFSEELGYDPEEWEECPPADHFLVFAPFTRFFLSVGAIGFAAFFFWLVDNHKNRGHKKEEEENVQEATQQSDLLSVVTGFLTGAHADPEFVQRSFRGEQESSSIVDAVREKAAEVKIRSEEAFHYKAPQEIRTQADVRAEVDQAAYELRDLLEDGSAGAAAAAATVAAPPVPPHRTQSVEESPVAEKISSGTMSAAQTAQDFLGQIPPPADLSESSQAIYDSVAEHATAAHDQAAAAAARAYDRVGESAAAAAAAAAHDAYDNVAAAAQESAAKVDDHVHDDFERVQKDLDNLMAEHQAPLGVIIPGASTSTTPVASLQQPEMQQEDLQHLQHLQQHPADEHLVCSPIDEHVRQLTAGLLTSEPMDIEKKPSDVPSLHDIYEERQRQMSPAIGSPVKMPTREEQEALKSWEAELARMEREKMEKLGDIIVGGDDASDIAASDGTEHLLPADHISMYSDESATVHQPEIAAHAAESLPATAKINQKIDAISSALEQSLLSEIEQLARQTSSMQAELARARDSEHYSTDELSEMDPRLQDLPQDGFQPARDVAFIPAMQQTAAPISDRTDEERQSGESDDFVKITPPSQSGAPSPSPAPVVMSSSEEEQLNQLVEEYDVIGSSSTLKKDASAPAELETLGAAAAEQQQQAAADPAEDIYPAQLQQHPAVDDAAHPSQLQQQQFAADAAAGRPQISAEEQAQLDQVLRDFEITPKSSDFSIDRPHPRTPPQTPERVLDEPPFEERRELSALKMPQGMAVITADGQSPTTEIVLPLAPRKSIGDLQRHFPSLPTQASIEVIDPAVAHLPSGMVIPSDLENVLASLQEEPSNLYLPSEGVVQQQDAAAAAAAAAAATAADHDQATTTKLVLPLAPRKSIGDLQQHFPSLPTQASIEIIDPEVAHLPKDVVLPSNLDNVHQKLVQEDSSNLFLPSEQPAAAAVSFTFAAAAPAAPAAAAAELETPILTGPTPEPSLEERLDAERKATVVAAPAAVADAAPAAPQLLTKQHASLDLSQPLQPAMSAFDRPAEGAKPVVANADFVVKKSAEEEPFASFSMKPQMMPAFEAQQQAQTTATAVIPHEELERADAIFQDALDYMHAQKPAVEATIPQATGFIMEEEMLSSHGENAPVRPIEKSADGTSKLIKTNEVFERQDTHDDHDDMTYAPEIQSLEIPPDQLSETSDLHHEDLPIDEPPAFKSPEAQKLEAEIRAQESAMKDAKATMEHRAPHIISMNSKHPRFPSTPSISSAKESPKPLRKQSSLLSILGVTSTQEMLLKIDSLEALSNAMRKAGLDSTNLIFGIDYTASNKYQGEESFGGHSLHTIHPNLKNPYQQVITILGRTLAPFTSTGNIPVYGFGDAKTSDWSVFSLKEGGHCTGLEEVLKRYNEVTPTVELSGPTNFSPLIYQAIEICQRTREYHILVIIADGQVTNEKATRRAIVQACQYPLSIIVVGVGDGPWDMMRVFDESLPKRPWDNFHFVEFHDVVKRSSGAADGDVKVAIQSLLEIPDQYRTITNLGLLKGRSPSTSHKK